MKRMLVAGAGGMTGSELTRQARDSGWHVAGLSRAELDITDAAAVDNAVRNAAPDVVINAAAYTAVDDAEGDRLTAMSVNCDGAANLAWAAGQAEALIIHISTDYVFDGEAARPYLPSDKVHPLSVYGESKRAGEEAVRARNPNHVIVRSSWVYSHTGRNFVRTMLRLAGEGRQIRVVDDQHGSPTSASDLAGALLRVANAVTDGSAARGTYHFSNAGKTTWCGFARALFEEKLDGRPTVHAIATEDFPTAARRPRYSVLDTTTFTRAFGAEPRPWRDALRSTLELL
ncbi:MAG: dTDP-4-dehydrorhamnose reductase [Gemmatimonadota bacterium]|nr:dTDP-4-dehydrorhamnose reductase [Gemmatimonadota bacterium]